MPIAQQLKFSSGEISPKLYGRIDLEVYYAACKKMENFLPLQYGAAKRRPGLRLVNECKFPDRKARLIPFIFSNEQAYVLEFGHQYMRVHYNGGTIVNADGTPYEIVSPYTEDQLDRIQFVQSADYLFLVNPAVRPKRLARRGHANWAFEDMIFGSTYRFDISNISYTDSDRSRWEADNPDQEYPYKPNTSYTYGITFVNADGLETTISNPSSVSVYAPLTYYRYVTLSRPWPTGDNYEYMKVYRQINGIWAYTGRAYPGPNNYTFIDNGTYAPDISNNPPEYTRDFTSAGNYPYTVTFDDNRLVFGGTDNNPNTIWGSAIGNFADFSKRNTVTATSAYEYRLNSDKINIINWMRSASKLLIGTSGGEWRLSDVRADATFEKRRSTATGSKPIQSLGVNQNTLFIDRVGKTVQAFSFDYTYNDYKSTNLNIWSEHLTRRRKITAWDYSAIPYSIIWCVCDDGIVINNVYNPDQNVVAWSRTITQGKFESVCAIPAEEQDDTYVIVSREINGQTVRFVEIFDEDFNGDIVEAFFVDCGVSYYYASPTKEIDDLDYLEGMEVSILADGGVQANRTVSGGKITLDYSAKIVHVGLPFVSSLQTMEIEGGSEGGGPSISQKRRIRSVVARFEESSGGEIGVSENDEDIIPIRNSYVGFGVPMPTFSGFEELTMPGGFDYQPTIFVTQRLPLPLTLSGLYPRVTSHGE